MINFLVLERKRIVFFSFFPLLFVLNKDLSFDAGDEMIFTDTYEVEDSNVLFSRLCYCWALK